MSSMARPLRNPAHFPLEKGLVLWLPFDDRSGSKALDRSIKRNHGALEGPTWTTGKRGSALKFDGSNDYVNVPYASSLDAFSALTVMCWIYPTAYGYPSYWRAVIDKNWRQNGAFSIYFDKNTAAVIYLAVQSDLGVAAYAWKSIVTALNAWYHIAGVWNGSTIVMYGNGAPGTAVAFSGTLTRTASVRIAQSEDDFKGIIDDVRIYNRALSTAEIKRVMESEINLMRS